MNDHRIRLSDEEIVLIHESLIKSDADNRLKMRFWGLRHGILIKTRVREIVDTGTGTAANEMEAES